MHPSDKMIKVDNYTSSEKAYSICTLVNNEIEYKQMCASFHEAGFTESDCEFLYIDNINSNSFDAYMGLNRAITASRGSMVILCHQDIRLNFDKREELEDRLRHLEEIDPKWAVVGNAGGNEQIGKLFIRISDPHGQDVYRGPLPHKVSALDENFILIKRSANLGLSVDLNGFHLYGTDLCQIANTLGHSCYVIDFHLKHLSPGQADQSFEESRTRLLEKYQKAFSPRSIQTNCTRLYLTGSRNGMALFNTKLMMRIRKRLQRLKKKPRN